MLRYCIGGAGYVEGVAVLRGLEGFVGGGELLVVAGPSGSGKTTAVLVLTGVLTNLLGGWARGRVDLCGVDPLDPAGFDMVPGLVGAVLQDPDKQLVMPTPYSEAAFTLENLGYGEEDVDRIVREALARFGLADKMFVHVEDLSGGEKRRLTFASSVVHRPRILFLDEPTANVDPWGVREIRGFVREMMSEGRTVVVVEHKLRYFLFDDARIHVIRGGRLVKELSAPLTGEEMRFLEEIGVDAGPPRIRDFPPISGEIVLSTRRLSVGYGGSPLLSDVELMVWRGEAVAVIGRNGAGKTTLLKTLAGALEPLDGEIILRGEKTVSKQRVRRVFYVPQTPDYLFVGTSLENELREASRRTGVPIEELAGLIPWYDERRKTSPYRLSHGQRRWLGIVVAYAYRPDVILLDEPSTGLDLGLFRRLVRLVDMLRRLGVSFIISTHDPRVVGEMCSRAYMVRDGRLEEVDRAEAVEKLEREAGLSLEEA